MDSTWEGCSIARDCITPTPIVVPSVSKKDTCMAVRSGLQGPGPDYGDEYLVNRRAIYVLPSGSRDGKGRNRYRSVLPSDAVFDTSRLAACMMMW